MVENRREFPDLTETWNVVMADNTVHQVVVEVSENRDPKSDTWRRFYAVSWERDHSGFQNSSPSLKSSVALVAKAAAAQSHTFVREILPPGAPSVFDVLRAAEAVVEAARTVPNHESLTRALETFDRVRKQEPSSALLAPADTLDASEVIESAPRGF
jgi:hypothetical protein